MLLATRTSYGQQHSLAIGLVHEVDCNRALDFGKEHEVQLSGRHAHRGGVSENQMSHTQFGDQQGATLEMYVPYMFGQGAQAD